VEYLLGIDLGTTGCKVMLFDPNGNSHAYSYQEYPLSIPAPGHHEQNPEDWWKALRADIKDVIRQSKVSPTDIAAIGLTTQADGLVCMGEGGRILRPAMIYSDRRAQSQAPDIMKRIGDMKGAADLLGMPFLYAPMSACARILWLRENEPQLEKHVHKYLDTKGYLAYKLTGEGAIDHYTAWMFGLANIFQKRWAKKMFDLLDLPLEKFGEIYSPSDVVGSVTEEASRDTGLSEGTPVSIGTWDGMVNIVGSGLTEYGMTMDVTGTTEIISTVLDQPSDRFLSYPYVIEGKYVLYASTRTTGACLTWFKDQFAKPEIEKAEKIGKSPYETMDIEAETVEPGSNNLVCLPFFEGLFAPEIIDIEAKGVFLGITLSHERRHFIRSIMEAVAYYLRDVLETYEGGGVKIAEPIRLSGGGAKSRVWNQIKADAMGKSVSSVKVFETGCLGVAILASVGIKMYKDVKDAIKSMVTVTETLKPRMEAYEKYTKLFEIYKQAYSQLKAVFPKLRET